MTLQGSGDNELEWQVSGTVNPDEDYEDDTRPPVAHALAASQLTLSGERAFPQTQLVVNQEYTREDLEKIFRRRFGWAIRRITVGKWRDGEDTPYILLTSSLSDPYSARIEGETLYYYGEGKGDQKYTTANRLLAESNTNGRIVYGLTQARKDGKWKYLGTLKVIEWHYIKKNGYLTFEYKLERQSIGIPPAVSEEEAELLNLLEKNPVLEAEKGLVQLKRKARSAAFSSLIRKNYGYSCAVCGKRRYTNAQYPEVEAAHIFPVENNGSDDLRNGIALCRLHHWAFDGGLISIDDSYTILGKDSMADDENYSEIWQYVGGKHHLPEDESVKPHSIYLQQHRHIHGFD